jgi:hypothetical protein
MKMAKHDEKKLHSTEPKGKKPYLKPSYQSEEVFETMALSCGKIESTQGQCHSNKKNS